jgi:hypothetical protein
MEPPPVATGSGWIDAPRVGGLLQDYASELLSWPSLYLGILWFAAGAFIAWNRGVAGAIYVPLLVAVMPSVVILASEASGEGFRLLILPEGADLSVYMRTIAIPFMASMLGGHVAAAVNPTRRKGRAARVLETQAYRHAMALEEEISQIANDLRGGPTHTMSSVDLAVLRARLALKESELRELRRFSRGEAA